MSKAPMILCCGEALIDMIPTPCADGATGFVPHAGGAIFNTAISLGRLGAPAGMLTGLSSDLFGAHLAESLRASKVDTGYVITADRPTTLAFVHLNGGQASYTFYDENSAGRMLTPQVMPHLSDEVGALYFGGISLAVDPGAEAYAALAERETARRAMMIDPNIRPGFIADPETYRARLDRMLRLADIVKLSDEDIAWLFPGGNDPARSMHDLQQLGPRVVILTRGAQGAEALLPDGSRVNVPAVPARVIDTVGAGDTFNAGVLAHLSEQGLLSKPALASIEPGDLRAALAFGTRVAAITVARAGANPPWRHDLPD